MTLDSFQVEHGSCSKCGRELTSPEEITGIVADIDSLICDACYQNLLFPEAKDYNCELMDHAGLTR